LLTIKDNAAIASGTRILTEDSSYINVGGRSYSAPVVIGENTNLGMNCIILPGVTIGKNSIIGAGSVVVDSIPPNSVAVGNPAKVLTSVEIGKFILKEKMKNASEKQK
ncbi:hypothetical protein KY366_07930, partial [Candidatus Woesearchaeota archaeon]|nr:hypothetical protein [Candidatus Woesearchaeota archaeon]